jgi:hypothetical protein
MQFAEFRVSISLSFATVPTMQATMRTQQSKIRAALTVLAVVLSLVFAFFLTKPSIEVDSSRDSIHQLAHPPAGIDLNRARAHQPRDTHFSKTHPLDSVLPQRLTIASLPSGQFFENPHFGCAVAIFGAHAQSRGPPQT